MALVDLENVNNNNGKCYLAIEDNQVIGLIMGTIPPFDKYDYLDYKCPKREIITELIVTKLLDIFDYNDQGINFYNNNGYHSIMYTK